MVDGKPVTRPITIEVIGDPHSLEEAAQFRGGIVSEITGPKIGGQVQIDELDRVVIESLHADERESVRSASIAAAHAALSDAGLECIDPRGADVPDYPEDLKYSAEHEWVRSGNGRPSGSASPSTPRTQLGDIVFVSLPAVGETVAAGDACGELESTKSVSDIFCPVPGVVSAVNTLLDSNPETDQLRPVRRRLALRARPGRRRRPRRRCSMPTRTPNRSADT